MMENKNPILNEDFYFLSEDDLVTEEDFESCPCCGFPLSFAIDQDGDYTCSYCPRCGDVSKLCEDIYKEQSLDLNTSRKKE